MNNLADQPVRWGIIGCGDVTEVKSGPALSKAPGSELVAVMRRSLDLAEDYAHRHNVPRAYDDASALLADPEIDAVYIATPPSSHAKYTVEAAHAGKAILCEKPMAISLGDCEMMARACEENKVKLVLAFYRRALPRFEKLRELVLDGAVGEVRTVRSCQYRIADKSFKSWKHDPEINGGGLFVDMQTHTLDWLDHTFGNAVTAAGIASNQSDEFYCEDTVSCTIEYYSGVLAHFDCCYDADHNEEHVTITGTKGRLQMPFFSEGPITLIKGDETERFELPDPEHVHQPFIEKTLAYLRNDGENPCDAATGWRNIELIKAVVVGD